jgi:hypothetical protein
MAKIKQTHGEGFTLLDDGKYVLKFQEIIMGKQTFINRDTGLQETKPNIKFIMEVVSGPHYNPEEENVGVTIWYFTPTTFSTHEKCLLMKVVKAAMFGGNFPPEDYDLDTDHLLDRLVEGVVGTYENKNGVEKNNITAWKPLPEQPVFDVDAEFVAPVVTTAADETDEIPF